MSVPRLALAAFVGMFVSACGDPPTPMAPLGVFELDREAMVTALQKQGIPEATARTHANGLRVELELRDDGTFLLRQKAGAESVEVRSGTWTQRGARISITTRRLAGQTIEPPSIVSALLDEDHLVFSADGGGGARGADTLSSGYVLVRR